MNRMAPVLTIVVMSMLVACAQQGPDQVGSGTPEAGPAVTATPGGAVGEMTPEPPTSTPIEPAAGGQKIVTLEDQGKTISLAVGEGFLLKLGDEYTWEITISDQNVLSRVKNIAVVRGAQGIYDALQAGTATLSATGDPQCRQSKPPCAMPSIQFEITVVVK
jgi:hypothetical protein